MRIFGWPADQSSGCWWYRIKHPLDALRALGHEVDYGQLAPPDWWDTPDVLVGQRVATPNATVTWQRLAASPNRPLLVYETDDDLLDVDPANTKAFQYFGQAEIRENIRRNVQVADLVTVTTEPLAAVLRPLNPNIVVLPNYLPRRALDCPLMTQPADGGPLYIGWAGTMTHVQDFGEVADALVRVVKQHPAVTYRSVGLLINGQPGLFASVKALADAKRATAGGWFALPYYYAALEFHIGIAPLAPTRFNQSKSCVKALEYSARGIATVASNYGPYADYIRHGETGLLATQPHEWVKHMRDLINDPAMRCEIAAKARSHAETLTIEDHAHEWADAYRSAL